MAFPGILHATLPVTRTLILAVACGGFAACAVPDGASLAEPELTSERASRDEGPRSRAEGAPATEGGAAGARRVSLEAPNGPITLAYETIDGLPLAEGDILLPVETRSATRIGRRWQGSLVPYLIERDLPEPARVDEAIAHWEARTNVRFVPRTTESDYVSFRPSAGCSSLVGRWGGEQEINLSTGEGAWNVVAVGIDPASDRVYWFYRRGFATVGTTSRAAAHQAHFRYALPTGKGPGDLVDVAFAAPGRVVAWYADGTVSEGTPADLAAHVPPEAYTLAPGKRPRDLSGLALDASGQAYAFYTDGAFTVGTTTDLDATAAPARYAVAPGRSSASLSDVDIAKDGAFHAFYRDGRTSSGTASDLGAAGAAQTVSFPGHCTVGSTIHEIGHAVGLFHEQTRNDRDQFVTVNWANIAQGSAQNFEKYGIATGNDSGPYDFASIMHYDSFAFTANGQPTLVKSDGTTIVANRTALSAGDVAAIALMYPAAPPTAATP